MQRSDESAIVIPTIISILLEVCLDIKTEKRASELAKVTSSGKICGSGATLRRLGMKWSGQLQTRDNAMPDEDRRENKGQEVTMRSILED